MLIKLNEDSRNKLLSKAKQGANYKTDQSKGRNRYERRTKSKISNSVKEYNRLNMNKFFKEDILDLNILVHGETDDYLVGISFSGILELIREETEKNQNIQVDLRLILQMLKRAFNREDHVLVKCSCPDWKYRMAYFASVNDIILGEKETIKSDKTNPDDKLGPACKHVILVLSNNSWIVKLASAINNYINYIKDHYEKNYAEIIFPQLYGMPYDDYVQLGLFDKDELDNTMDSETNVSRNVSDDEKQRRQAEIDKLDTTSANRYGGSRTQFKKGNTQGIRFAQNEISDDDQLELDLR